MSQTILKTRLKDTNYNEHPTVTKLNKTGIKSGTNIYIKKEKIIPYQMYIYHCILNSISRLTEKCMCKYTHWW